MGCCLVLLLCRVHASFTRIILYLPPSKPGKSCPVHSLTGRPGGGRALPQLLLLLLLIRLSILLDLVHVTRPLNLREGGRECRRAGGWW